MGGIKAHPKVSHLSLQLTDEDENLSAAAWRKTNLGGDGGAFALPGVSCFPTLNLETARALLQYPPRAIGLLDRAPQVLEPWSCFDHEHLLARQVLSMPRFGVISWCDFCRYLPLLAVAGRAAIS